MHWRRWLKWLAMFAAAGIIASVFVVLPLRWFDPVTTTFMLQDDRPRDALLHEWVPWEDIGIAPVLAVVAAEDQNFADHHGLDIDSILGSIEDRKKRGQLRGASTISQQTTKNLFLWPGRNFLRKGLEAYLTLVVEVCLSKQRILEIYLNVAEFGPGIYGIGAASRHFFNKPSSQLSDSEAALLAAVLPSPSRLRADRPSAYVRERQIWILAQLQRLRRESWIRKLQSS